jgi:hypothetical protein
MKSINLFLFFIDNLMISKPNKIDTPVYYHYYIDLIEENDLISVLISSKTEFLEQISSIPFELENHAYEEGKWYVKEVIRHIIDTERIFQYRALRFSRLDDTELAGYDENVYITNSKNLNYSLLDLAEEFEHVRNSTIHLFNGLTDDLLDFRGTANKTQLTTRGIGFMIVGHQLHHMNVLKVYMTNKGKALIMLFTSFRTSAITCSSEILVNTRSISFTIAGI